MQHDLPEIIVLMYHRIDDVDTNPWGICVSPAHFEEQVKFLKNNYNIVSIDEAINQVKEGNINSNSICITFDDGYSDNYLHAQPVLEKYNCPATFFIATAFIGQSVPFWWDELEMILLHSKKLPQHLSLEIDGENNEYFLSEEELTGEKWLQHINWKWHEEPPTDRCAAFLDIWEKLRQLLYEEIKKQIELIRNWALIKNKKYTSRLPLNETQLHKLLDNNLFTIGMHTHSHPDLEGKEKRFQFEEIIMSKTILENTYGLTSNYLSYPFGRYNDDTIEVIQELRVAGCFTTEAVSINANTDLARLGRHQIFDWDIETFEEQIINLTKKVRH